MCGINGIFAYNASAAQPRREELLATRDHMAARGPDGAGEWWSDDKRLGLGHRRLAIIDLSDRASQPMASACGRYLVTFNGEIYNYPELRRELEARGAKFRTTSDTEVLLHLYAERGDDMVHALRGMFAFAIWDKPERRLFLARDAYGIKPLYVADDGWTFRFASQVKALLAGGGISRDPEPAGVVGFHLWGSVPEPFTLYRDIRALPAGHCQVVDETGPHEARRYVSIPGMLARGARHPAAAAEAPGRIRDAVAESVRAHLLADVEVGVFLSRGIDSGALLGLVKDAGQARVTAITLQFNEFAGTGEDEVAGASRMAQLYGANHKVRLVEQAEFRDDMPAILAAMDQPTIDGVNMWFITKAAREAGLKVALSGLGGDELLAGYPSFRDIPLAVGLLRAPAAFPGLGQAWRGMAALTGAARRQPKASGLLSYGGDYAGAYFLRRGLFLPFELDEQLDPQMVRQGLQRLRLLDRLREATSPQPASPVSRVSALESCQYMRNQLLRDADWAGMAHSVEVRTPLVDVRLLERLAPVIPALKGRMGKLALAAAPTQPIPQDIAASPKLGFSVPIGSWLQAGRRAATKGAASRSWAGEVFAKFMPQAAPAPSLDAAA